MYLLLHLKTRIKNAADDQDDISGSEMHDSGSDSNPSVSEGKLRFLGLLKLMVCHIYLYSW